MISGAAAEREYRRLIGPHDNVRHPHMSALHDPWQDSGFYLPRNVGPLQVAIDPGISGAVTLDGSSNISRVADASGNNRAATQGTAANRPGYSAADASLNNQPTMKWTAGAGSVGLDIGGGYSLNEPYTAVIVAIHTAGATFKAALGQSFSFMLGSSSTDKIIGTAFTGTALNTTVSATSKHVIVMQGNANGSTSAILVDSSSATSITATQGATGTSAVSIGYEPGASNQFLGSIGGVWIYNTVLATGSAGLVSLVKYLGARFAIAVT